jgi:hypothetical protein
MLSDGYLKKKFLKKQRLFSLPKTNRKEKGEAQNSLPQKGFSYLRQAATLWSREVSTTNGFTTYCTTASKEFRAVTRNRTWVVTATT